MTGTVLARNCRRQNEIWCGLSSVLSCSEIGNDISNFEKQVKLFLEALPATSGDEARAWDIISESR